MNNALSIDQPTANARNRIQLWWRHLRNTRGASNASIREERDAIIALQWLVAIALSYLVFAVQNWDLADPGAAMLISVSLASALVLQRIPEAIFDKDFIVPGLVVLDSLLIVSAIFLREQTPWDLLMLFLFCVSIAAIGENLIQVGVVSVLLSIVFLLYVSPNARDASTISPDLLIRVPFMFGISLFYGFMTNRVRQERKRIAQMEDAVRLKRQIVSALAHDIKTPLNVIGGYAELLAGEYGGQEDPTERRLSLNRIRENIDRIVQLVTDFLSISKLETSELEAARNLVQINAIAESVVLEQTVTARAKNLNLKLDLDRHLKPIVGDNNQLERALWNLVGNAIKFISPGGTISIRSRMVEKYVSIQVTDNGAGIPKEELPHLFCEFKRLKGSAQTEGSGLGLFIVKTIVEAHNGSVAVESEEGVGTTFTILLPVSKTPSTHMQPNVPNNKFETETLEHAA